MPGIDNCQAAVIRALEQSRLRVVTTQKYLAYSLLTRSEVSGIYVDLELISGNPARDARWYVEVNCLSVENDNKDFYAAVGQYLSYRAILSEVDPGVPLYLALPQQTYDLLSGAIRRLLNERDMKLILVDLTTERVVRWIG